MLSAAGVASPEPRGLAIWSAASGALMLFPLFRLFAALDRSRQRAWWATLLVALSPLFWFTALRPLSDMTGLAAAVLAQALTLSAIAERTRARPLVWAAFIAGLAIGIRSQTALLTLPLLALALVWRPLALSMRDRTVVVVAAAAGMLVWAVPLIAASGGPSAYAAALGTQAGEDFSGVVMLWNMRQARVAADALIYSFAWPWGAPVAGAIVLAVAALGLVRAAVKSPRVLALILLAFGPYAVFHLLFHEVVTTRYALPLVVPAAFFVVQALDLAGGRAVAAGASALGVWSLSITIPAMVLFGGAGSPTFRAFQDVIQAAGDDRAHPRVIAMHAVMRRAADWMGTNSRIRMVKAFHGREWLALVEVWRSAPEAVVSYIADPRRTDLALIDPASRRGPSRYRWPFVEAPFVGGARPGDADVYAMRAPGWMLDRGWALTAEVAGVTARDGWGPHLQPSVAWVRARPDAATLILGGRHLVDGAAPVRIAVVLDGATLDSFETGPGYFF
ncbi:MAG TPA: glycosyltransferase family 39 protein, partial [Gemmatimonadaceae bacterium]|nr:glycosyltransferase family 39 protein [Gemmatimonadaceae bacterium]